MKHLPIFDEIFEWVKTILIAVVIALLLRGLVISPFKVSMTSMYPTLQPDDLILVDKLTYKFRLPMPGDIIVFHSPLGESKDFVKRVIAVGGDEIEGVNGQLFVNKELLKEPYLSNNPNISFPSQVIEDGKYFVMGDNRDNSLDSRSFGPIEKKEIVGRVLLIFWPFNRWERIWL